MLEDLTPERREDLARRLWLHSTPQPSGCWVYDRAKSDRGYAVIGIEGTRAGLAHRVAFELVKGPIPEGLTIDHLCRNRACVNPGHLDACTVGENSRRSPHTRQSINAAKTHCARGHEYTESNTKFRMRGGRRSRVCRECARQDARARAARERGAS